MSTAAEAYLAQATLMRLLAVLTLVIAPHLTRMPWWIALMTGGLVVWRALAARRDWPLPGVKLKVALTLAGFAGVYVSFGSPSGQTAGTTLLALMLALKLTEMRSRRDVFVVVSLCYFMLLTHFLFSQEIWTVFYLLACAWCITALTVEANHGGQPLPPRITLRLGGAMVAQALPLMVLLFVLFPRIPGPLWGLPQVSGASRSGLSDSLSPGDISQLIQSEETAFRVRFDGELPPPRERYWRGPSFERFDGRRWTHVARDFMDRSAPPARAVLRGTPLRYEITLEPHDKTWMFALDLPDPDSLPEGSFLDMDLLLTARKPVHERWLYRLASHAEFDFEHEMPPELQRIYTRLPPRGNPQARDWAQQLGARLGGDAQAIADALHAHFRSEQFFYTLQPPRLGRDAIDDFFFNTRRGFCEHYASTFTFLMRAAGVPARVVTGYQGGDVNDVGGYLVVSQSDAHAWSEYWLPARGWVRADPTAAVAPIRVEQGLAQAIPATEGLPGYLARRGAFSNALEARMDWIEAGWNRWVLAYGPELQERFLSRFGLVNWGDMMLALTVLVSLVLGAVGAFNFRLSRPVQKRDEALRQWRMLEKRLARLGFVPHTAEGPRDFIQRVTRQRPDLRPVLNAAGNAYLHARYLDEQPDEPLRRLYTALKAIG